MLGQVIDDRPVQRYGTNVHVGIASDPRFQLTIKEKIAARSPTLAPTRVWDVVKARSGARRSRASCTACSINTLL